MDLERLKHRLWAVLEDELLSAAADEEAKGDPRHAQARAAAERHAKRKNRGQDFFAGVLEALDLFAESKPTTAEPDYIETTATVEPEK